MKKFMPENPEYWIRKGFSIELANVEANKRKGGRYGGHKNYYLLRNLATTEQEAIQLAEDWKDKNCTLKRDNAITNRFGGNAEDYKKWKLEKCNLSKKNLLKRMSESEYIKHKHDLGMNLIGNGPMYVQYWINQGYTKNYAKQKIKEIARKRSKRCIEYWIDAGYSLEEAVLQVKLHQNNVSIKKFIERHGEAEGTLKYEEYCYLRQLGSIRSYLYWIGLGYTEDNAKIKAFAHSGTRGFVDVFVVEVHIGRNRQKRRGVCFFSKAPPKRFGCSVELTHGRKAQNQSCICNCRLHFHS